MPGSCRTAPTTALDDIVLNAAAIAARVGGLAAVAVVVAGVALGCIKQLAVRQTNLESEQTLWTMHLRCA